jgi:hypothetical protein
VEKLEPLLTVGSKASGQRLRVVLQDSCLVKCVLESLANLCLPKHMIDRVTDAVRIHVDWNAEIALSARISGYRVAGELRTRNCAISCAVPAKYLYTGQRMQHSRPSMQ